LRLKSPMSIGRGRYVGLPERTAMLLEQASATV
jgi:hypothetical protein